MGEECKLPGCSLRIRGGQLTSSGALPFNERNWGVESRRGAPLPLFPRVIVPRIMHVSTPAALFSDRSVSTRGGAVQTAAAASSSPWAAVAWGPPRLLPSWFPIVTSSTPSGVMNVIRKLVPCWLQLCRWIGCSGWTNGVGVMARCSGGSSVSLRKAALNLHPHARWVPGSTGLRGPPMRA